MASILIVDDEPNIRRVLYDLLTDEYLCRTAGTGEEAIKYLLMDDYDVVLLDISLPGMSGLELLGHIRQRWPEIIIIIISAITDPAYIEGFIRYGVFAYFSKPFILAHVKVSVAEAVAHRKSAVKKGNQAAPDEQKKTSAEDETDSGWDILDL
jgi:DNA-binding NtrC family response regulator